MQTIVRGNSCLFPFAFEAASPEPPALETAKDYRERYEEHRLFVVAPRSTTSTPSARLTRKI